MKADLALPLFALVDRAKVDPAQSDLADLAAHLGEHFENSHGVAHDAVVIEGGAVAGGEPELHLIFIGVPESSWPAFLALAAAQNATPHAFTRDSDSHRFTLRPLGVKH